MLDVDIDFEIVEEGESTHKDLKQVTGHLIFDKTDFARKARWFLDIYKTQSPERSTHASAVVRNALNGLEVFAGDIRNTILQDLSCDKHCVTCGPKFGIEHEGNRDLIERTVHMCKVAGRDFKNNLRS